MQKTLRRNLTCWIEEGRFCRSKLLYPISRLFSLCSSMKNSLYDREILRSEEIDACVVSVGGITAGGTGKTPLVHLLAQTFSKKIKTAIVSRGYRARESGLPLGDELTMLSRRLQDVSCFAHPDRRIAARLAVAEGAKLIILDDGMQFRALKRDFELVILDANNPFGYSDFLPRGLLREPPRSLARADALFVSGPIQDDSFRKWSQSPTISLQLQVKRMMDPLHQKEIPLRSMSVGAFCAIARPNRFIKTLQNMSVSVVDHCFLSDHDRFSYALLKDFSLKCQKNGASALICTEKDVVKLQQFETALPIYYLEMEYKVVSGQSDWDNLIEKINQKTKELTHE